MFYEELIIGFDDFYIFIELRIKIIVLLVL